MSYGYEFEPWCWHIVDESDMQEVVEHIAEHGDEYPKFCVYKYPATADEVERFEIVPYVIECPWEVGDPVEVMNHRDFAAIPSDVCDDWDAFTDCIRLMLDMSF